MENFTLEWSGWFLFLTNFGKFVSQNRDFYLGGIHLLEHLEKHQRGLAN